MCVHHCILRERERVAVLWDDLRICMGWVRSNRIRWVWAVLVLSLRSCVEPKSNFIVLVASVWTLEAGEEGGVVSPGCRLNLAQPLIQKVYQRNCILLYRRVWKTTFNKKKLYITNNDTDPSSAVKMATTISLANNRTGTKITVTKCPGKAFVQYLVQTAVTNKFDKHNYRKAKTEVTSETDSLNKHQTFRETTKYTDFSHIISGTPLKIYISTQRKKWTPFSINESWFMKWQ